MATAVDTTHSLQAAGSSEDTFIYSPGEGYWTGTALAILSEM